MINNDLPRDVAKHLVNTYGTAALRVVELGESNAAKRLKGINERVHPDYPFLFSEVSYAAHFEMATKPNDILCRRVPVALLDRAAGENLLTQVVDILGQDLKWSSSKKTEEMKNAAENIKFVL